MATKKAVAKASTSSRTAAAKKTTVKKPAAKVAAAKTSKTAVIKRLPSLPGNIGNRILAEIVGTFILALVALTTASMGALYVGLALVVIVMALGAVSGAHVNPAVTFGLWVARQINWLTGLVYWAAQFVGAMLAVAVVNLVSSGYFTIGFGSLSTISWPILAVELVGAAVFVFGLLAVWNRDELTAGAKAFGIGLSLAVGLFAAGSLLNFVQLSAYQTYQKDSTANTSGDPVSFPRQLNISSAVLNPAVALAVTEDKSLESSITGSSADEGARTSRFGLEVVLGTLAGAALGSGLYLLTNFRPRKKA